LRLKQKLKAGQPTFGAWLAFTDPAAAEIMTGCGFDWLLIDAEHSPFTLDSLLPVLMAFNGRETVPLIRVPSNDRVPIKQFLDLGAEGILVPMVNSAQEARQAVAACKYPPVGVRGFGPKRASNYNRDSADYIRTANESLLVLIQIEHIEAVGRIEEILTVPGLDAVLLGPMDLSASMGRLGQIEHPEVQAAIEKVIAAARKAGLPVGVPMAADAETLMKWAARGCNLLITGEQDGLLRRAAESALATFKRAYN
jgi:2-keto-3-deoxy-L-rhamnonate aldolase RhmA